MPVMSVGLSRRAQGYKLGIKKKKICDGLDLIEKYGSCDGIYKNLTPCKSRLAHFPHSKLWTCPRLEGAFVGGKILSQL